MAQTLRIGWNQESLAQLGHGPKKPCALNLSSTDFPKTALQRCAFQALKQPKVRWMRLWGRKKLQLLWVLGLQIEGLCCSCMAYTSFIFLNQITTVLESSKCLVWEPQTFESQGGSCYLGLFVDATGLLIERGSRLFLQSLASWLFSCFSVLDIDALDGRYVSWLACQWWARCTQVCEYLNKPDFLKWRSYPSMLSNCDYLGSCHSSADRRAIAAFPGLWHRATNKKNRSEKKWSGRTPWIGMVPLRFLQLLMQTRLAFSFFSHSMWWSCSFLAVGMPGGQNQSQQLVINLRSWNRCFLRCHGYYVAEAKTFKAIGGVAIPIFVWRRIAISHTTLVRLCEVHSSKVDEAPEMVAGQHLVTNIPPLLSLFRMWHTTFVVILMKSRWHIPDLLEAMTSGPFSSVQLIGKHSFIESTHPKIPSIQFGFTYGKTDTIALLMWFLCAKLRTGPLHCWPLRIWMLIHCSCLCNFRLGGSSCVTGAAWKCYTKGCWRRLQHPWSWVQTLLTFAPPKNGSPQCSKATLLEQGSLQLDTPAADAIGDSAAFTWQSMCEAFGGWFIGEAH